MTTITHVDAPLRALSADEIDTIAGAALASPTFRLVIAGYGIEFNSRTACVITPEGSVCKNIPKS
jgi:hypothetical protein